jgi:hypothetical protein
VARELRKDKGRGTVKSAEWSESEGLLMFRGKIYVPKDRELRRRIIMEQHHDTRVAGHAGHFKTLKMVLQIIGGHRCLDILVSMSRHVIYAIERSCNNVDPPENSIRLKLQKSDGR